MKITTLFRSALAVAAIGAATALTPIAHADTLHTTGFAEGSQTFGLSIGGSVPVGGFEGEWNGTDIYFWCVQLDQYFSFGNNYTDYVPVPEMSSTVVTLLGQLFTLGYANALIDTDHSAAFQLAIWEIVYDSSNLSLTGGSLYITQANGHANTLLIAKDWLTNLGTVTDQYHLSFLNSPGHQDFVTPDRVSSRSVPEPHGLALIAFAMLAMIGVLRARRRW